MTHGIPLRFETLSDAVNAAIRVRADGRQAHLVESAGSWLLLDGGPATRA